MFIQKPKNPNGIVVIADLRLRTDKDLDEKEGGQHVLEFFTPMKAALGADVWRRTTRIALFDHGANFEAKTKAERAAVSTKRSVARQNARKALLELKPKVIICLGTRETTVKSKDAESGEAAGHKGCMAWTLFDAPDSLPAMAGCLWKSPLGAVVGVPHPGGQEFVHGENFRRWCVRAAKYSFNPSELLLPPSIVTSDGPEMIAALRALLAAARAGAAVSVDIESYMDGSVITCVGFSDGQTTVSVPWEEFQPHGQDYQEPAASPLVKSLAEQILLEPCPKILHNGISFDGPLLEAHGSPMRGRLIDTYLMHGAIYNQYRHGLQAVAASSFLCPPWKSVHKKQGPDSLTPDDAEFWICNPKALREYNCCDAFYTYWIYKDLEWRLG